MRFTMITEIPTIGEGLVAALMPTQKGFLAGVDTTVIHKAEAIVKGFAAALKLADVASNTFYVGSSVFDTAAPIAERSAAALEFTNIRAFAGVDSLVHREMATQRVRLVTSLVVTDKGAGARMGLSVIAEAATGSERLVAALDIADKRAVTRMDTPVIGKDATISKCFLAPLVFTDEGLLACVDAATMAAAGGAVSKGFVAALESA